MNKPETAANPTRVVINVDYSLSFAEINATIFGARARKGFKVTLAEFMSANKECLDADDLKGLSKLANKYSGIPDNDGFYILDCGTAGYSIITILE